MSPPGERSGAGVGPLSLEFGSFDQGFALRQCNGNRAIMVRLVTRFARALEENRRTLDEHISRGRAEQAAGLAHKIKGSSAALGAGPIRERSKSIETLCRASRLQEAATEVRALRGEVKSFQADAGALERSTAPLPDARNR